MSKNSLLDFYREIVNSEKSFDIDYKNLSKQLIERIDKAIEYIKNNWYSKNTRNIEELHSLGDWRLDLLEILGDKENE